MSDKKKRKEAFLQEHPWCCFCGGGERATTWDHQPARTMFIGREWPEGMQFPACEECNCRTRGEEQIVAFYALAKTTADSVSTPHFERLRDGLANNRPDMLPRTDFSALEKKAYLRDLRKLGVDVPPGIASTADFVLAKAPPDIVQVHRRYFSKLFCALFYKEVGRIFPANGAMRSRVFTDRVVDLDQMQRAMGMLENSWSGRRGRRDLSSQFLYRFSIAESPEGITLMSVIGQLQRAYTFYAMGSSDMDFAFEQRASWHDIWGDDIERQSSAA